MTDKRDDIADDEALDGDRAGGWAGVPEALGEAADRGAGPDHGQRPLDDETPGSQGEIDPGSEGDFGHRNR